MSRTSYVVMPILALACALAAGCNDGQQPGPSSPSGDEGAKHPLHNKPGPDFSRDIVANGKATFSSYKGKVLIVDFWATWCEPCKKSFPKLQELYTKYKGQLEIVAISEDEENQGLKDFADSHGSAKFPIVFDEGKSIAGKWHPDKMPSTFVVDKAGVVKFVHLGYHDGEEADIEREVKGLL
jgi:cytochrome c biogenesis protein CcmG/thiol:disulfide interchange protein DsbE